VLGGASEQARRMASFRLIASLIAEARG
jgi:hypothetical protein